VVCLNVCEEGGDLSGCGEVLMAVGVGERVLRCVEVGGWCSEFFTEEDRADRIIIPQLLIKPIQILHCILANLVYIWSWNFGKS